MEEQIKDNRLEQVYEQWITQWNSIQFPKNISWQDKFSEYQKWRDFLSFWLENLKGRDMNEALEVYKLTNLTK